MIKLFTDSDLDGLGCGLLAKLAFKDEVDIVYCTYRNLDYRVKKFLDHHDHKQAMVYITDLSVNKENELKLAKRYESTKKVQMIDHHVTALHFNKYNWAFVKPEYESGKKTCATSLLYEFLVDKQFIQAKKSIDEFVELVRQYDTWEWEINNNLTAKRLNDLFSIVGRKQFEQELLGRLANNDETFTFTDAEHLLLDVEEKKIERYINAKNKQLVQTYVKDKCVGIVHAENYHSELGNALNKKNPHLDLIVILNTGNKAIGFRTIHDHIDVSEFAEGFGGGGHKKASGCSLTNETFQTFVIEPFDIVSLRPDPEMNQYNIKGSKFGTWYEARNGYFYLITQRNDEWELYEETDKKISGFPTFNEAENYLKRNFVASLLFDKEFIHKMTALHSVSEAELTKNFEATMTKIMTKNEKNAKE